MADMVETMAYTGLVPWHGLGVKIEEGLSPEEILKKAGLDWVVKSVPLCVQWNGQFEEVPGQYASQRQTDGNVLAITTEKYKVVQNADALDFFSKFTKAGKMTMETAGSLDSGRFIWALARIDKSFKLPGKDEMLAYLLLMQPHRIGYAMVIDFTSIRVVCWNTLNMALGRQLQGSGRAFRMPHLSAFDDAMKAKAEIALGLATEQFQFLQDAAEMLAGKKIANQNELQVYFDAVMEFNREKEGDENEPKILERFRYAYDDGPGSRLASASGTYWGAVNAVTYVVDHHSGRTDDTRLKGAWLGSGATRKRRALELAIDFAKAA